MGSALACARRHCRPNSLDPFVARVLSILLPGPCAPSWPIRLSWVNNISQSMKTCFSPSRCKWKSLHDRFQILPGCKISWPIRPLNKNFDGGLISFSDDTFVQHLGWKSQKINVTRNRWNHLNARSHLLKLRNMKDWVDSWSCWKLEPISHLTHFVQNFIGTKNLNTNFLFAWGAKMTEYKVVAWGIPCLQLSEV
jgi:hypothetical protein